MSEPSITLNVPIIISVHKLTKIVGETMKPEDVFSQLQMIEWARANGWQRIPQTKYSKGYS